MPKSITCWVDGQGSYNHIDDNLRPYFDKNHGKYTPCIVGVILNKHGLNVFLPHNMSLSYKITPHTIKLLCHFIYKDLEQAPITSLNNHCKTYYESDSLLVILWLIHDFWKYGCYKKSIRHRIHGKSSKDIDWSYTIKNQIPLMTSHGYLYPNPFHYHTNHVITWLSDLHRAVIDYISKKYEFLLNGFSYHNPYPNIHLTKSSVRIYIRKLHLLSNRTSNYHLRYLIRVLITFLNDMADQKSSLSLVTKSFWYVFERELKLYVHSDDSLKQFVHQPHWTIKLSWMSHPLKSHNREIPDALVLRPDHRVIDIYDAKYYDLTHYHNKNYVHEPPLQSESINKQYHYAEELDSKFIVGSNTFVFPLENAGRLKLRPFGHLSTIMNGSKHVITSASIDPMKLLNYNYKYND